MRGTSPGPRRRFEVLASGKMPSSELTEKTMDELQQLVLAARQREDASVILNKWTRKAPQPIRSLLLHSEIYDAV